MNLEVGTRVVLSQTVGEYPAGTPGVVMRVDLKWVAAHRYNVLLDGGGALEDLTEDQLFAPDGQR